MKSSSFLLICLDIQAKWMIKIKKKKLLLTKGFIIVDFKFKFLELKLPSY